MHQGLTEPQAWVLTWGTTVAGALGAGTAMYLGTGYGVSALLVVPAAALAGMAVGLGAARLLGRRQEG